MNLYRLFRRQSHRPSVLVQRLLAAPEGTAGRSEATVQNHLVHVQTHLSADDFRGKRLQIGLVRVPSENRSGERRENAVGNGQRKERYLGSDSAVRGAATLLHRRFCFRGRHSRRYTDRFGCGLVDCPLSPAQKNVSASRGSSPLDSVFVIRLFSLFIIIFRYDPFSEIYFQNIFHICEEYRYYCSFRFSFYFFYLSFSSYVDASDGFPERQKCIFVYGFRQKPHKNGESVQVVQYSSNYNQPTTSLKSLKDINALVDDISVDSNRLSLAFPSFRIQK